MEYQQDNNNNIYDSAQSQPRPQTPEPFQSPISSITTPPPKRKWSVLKFIWGLFTFFSVLANVFFFLVLVGIIAYFVSGQSSVMNEEVIIESHAGQKIVVVNINGILYDQQAESVKQQLKQAKKDKSVKAVIVQINSPGGTISASDQINYEIRKFRNETHLPVIAFMQGTAASGGYYCAVACQEIIAEPTTITGSIGVISEYFVLQDLLEEKLGVLPVIIKSGQKKDWPSSFRKPTETELQYINDRLIAPAIDKFKNVVAEGRKHALTPEDVNNLADGSIYFAPEAKTVKLIDNIGYLDDAVKRVKSLADLKNARVVRYRKPFSLSDILSYRTEAQNLLKFDRDALHELTRPQFLYLWGNY